MGGLGADVESAGVDTFLNRSYRRYTRGGIQMDLQQKPLGANIKRPAKVKLFQIPPELPVRKNLSLDPDPIYFPAGSFSRPHAKMDINCFLKCFFIEKE